jgi:redox-sensitive bicupin YhaK (pirin superfamily)
MIATVSPASFQIYPPAQQGKGSFDGGKITEIKPIDFPGGTSAAERIGPLFYWAWASSKGQGRIDMHPHRGFEIISYVLQGEIGHRDSLGHRSRIGRGGVQVMKSGRGLQHEEEVFSEATEFFQIWFQPNLSEALQQPPVYSHYREEDFPVYREKSASVTSILGPCAPVRLQSDVWMDDVTLSPGGVYPRLLGRGRCLAVSVISGEGYWKDPITGKALRIRQYDFSVIEAGDDASILLQAGEVLPIRAVMIDVPRRPTYPLHGA